VRPVAGPDMCRLVEAKGWILQRIYSKAGVPKVISIPLHGSRDLKPGLADRIARDAGVEL